MKPFRVGCILSLLLLAGFCASGQIYDTNGDFVQTFVGSEFYGYADGVGGATMFYWPSSIAADSGGNLFVWDAHNYRIREISPIGVVTTFAGGGNQTTGIGTNVNLFPLFSGQSQMAIDSNNDIWMAIWQNASGITLYKISHTAFVTNYFISLPPGTTFSGSTPVGICVDSLGNIYLSRFYENQIYKRAANGSTTLFAGSGNPGHTDGNGIFTSFDQPTALACDQADNIYVWDAANNLIRRIDQNTNVTTFAGKLVNPSNGDGIGTNASFGSINQMCFDKFGNLLLACGSCVRKIDVSTNVVTLAGSFTESGYTNDVPGNLARFSGAQGVCLSGGTIYVADSLNERIRAITNSPAPQVVSPSSLGIGTFAGVTINGVVGRTYQIQSSPDSIGWSTRATVLLNSKPYLWIDRNPIAGNNFYRALLMP